MCALRAHVATYERAKSVPTAHLSCQGAKFSTWRVNVPKGVLIFLTIFQ